MIIFETKLFLLFSAKSCPNGFANGNWTPTKKKGKGSGKRQFFHFWFSATYPYFSLRLLNKEKYDKNKCECLVAQDNAFFVCYFWFVLFVNWQNNKIPSTGNAYFTGNEINSKKVRYAFCWWRGSALFWKQFSVSVLWHDEPHTKWWELVIGGQVNAKR